MIALDIDGTHRIMYIARISEGVITLAEHFEANSDARNRNKADPFKYTYKSPTGLKEANARLVGVSLLGYVNTKAKERIDGRHDRGNRDGRTVPIG
jgi:CRISPR-associated endonuclease Csn1